MQQNRVEARFIAAFVVLLLSCPVVFASEQPYLQRDSKWKNARITLSLSRSTQSSGNIQADVGAVLERSLSAWSRETTIGFKVVESDGLSVSQKGARGDGISLITSAATPENLSLFPRQAGSRAAVTRVFRDARGSITEADIVLNPFVRFSTDGSFDTFDLQDTLTHEIGHLLGLEHLPVWGSIMNERAGKSLGPASYRGSRDILAKVDASLIKSLYGSRPDDVSCCGTVSGRISGSLANTGGLVWTEEIDTGRLIAATVPEKDGSYRLDGVPEGEFLIFSSLESRSDDFASDSAKITVSIGEPTKKNFDLRLAKSGVRVQLIGTSMLLGALPVDLSSVPPELFVGVDGLPQNVARISGSSILFEQTPMTKSVPLFSSVKVVGYGLSFPSDLPKGEYTLVIEGNTGVRQYLVGSLINR